MKIAFYTLGCKVNQYDTSTMIESFKSTGHEIVDFDDIADCYVINTCTVTAMSDKKSRQIISRAHEKNKDAIVCVAGCFAQNDAELALSLPGVRVAIGTSDRSRIVEVIESLKSDEKINAVKSVKYNTIFEELPAVTEGRTRAVLKIQEGCDRFCSYCIIPFARGAKKSRGLDAISRETQRLADAGFKEIVLTGIHLSSYECGDGNGLISAMKAVADVDGVERIRLSSLEACVIDEKFVEYCSSESKICQHFHLSLQSGSDGVLSRMNRRYTSGEYLEKVETIRKHMPNATFTTDIIAGFPGESEEEHIESKNFIEKIGFYKVHVFPYSQREGTIAAKMPDQVDMQLRRSRAKEIGNISKELENRFLEQSIGKTEKVLIEKTKKNEDNMCFGLTMNYLPVKIRCDSATNNTTNNIINIIIDNKEDLILLGTKI